MSLSFSLPLSECFSSCLLACWCLHFVCIFNDYILLVFLYFLFFLLCYLFSYVFFSFFFFHFFAAEGADPKKIMQEATTAVHMRYNFFETTIQIEDFTPEMETCTQCTVPEVWADDAIKRRCCEGLVFAASFVINLHNIYEYDSCCFVNNFFHFISSKQQQHQLNNKNWHPYMWGDRPTISNSLKHSLTHTHFGDITHT